MQGFSAAFPIKIGRVDASSAKSNTRLFNGSEEVSSLKEIFDKLGVKKERRLFTERQQFLLFPLLFGGTIADAEQKLVDANPSSYKEWLSKYQKSRRTVTRTDYEVDFIDAFTRLCSLASFDPDAYLIEREPIDISKLKL